MAALAARAGVASRALEITVLTALRTNEVINAKWNEIDLVAGVWIVPAERMKAGREHRVPLCDKAIRILSSLPREQGTPFVFLGGRQGKPLSNMAMLKILRKLRPGVTVHGFRSTFRDWAAELTAYPNHVVEMALAHAVRNKVEAAYRRGDLVEKRMKLMTDWAAYCSQLASPTDNVFAFRGSAA